MSRDENFLSRWSRRKHASAGDGPVDKHAPASQSPAPPQPAQAQLPAAGGSADPGVSRPSASVPGAGGPGASLAARAAPAADAGAPGVASEGESRDGEPGQGKAALPPLESLGPDSDFSGFMQAGVDPSTRASALRRLFADPHFNQMDGLDIYIDDYGKPDPIPLAMLRIMKQAHSLGLFDSADDDGPRDGSTDPQAPAGDSLARVDPDRNAPPGDAPSDDGPSDNGPSDDGAEPHQPIRS